MSVERFQKLAEQIIEHPWLGESQQEERITQVADLCRFISSYKPSIRIEDAFSHKINVIEDEGIRKGVLFCDYSPLLSVSFDFSLFNFVALQAFKTKENIQELWIVFIESKGKEKDPQFTNIPEKKRIAAFYDKIFCFDFFQSKIQTIK